MLDAARAAGVVPCVGNIAHAIARYQDYKGRTFPELAADWGSQVGDPGNGNVARGRGPNDFQVWHWNRWIEQSGLSALYFDENYLGEDYNYLTGGAYLLPDGNIQPGYDYLGLREMDKRLRYVFRDHGIAPPNLWLHTTGGQAVYAWMPDVAMEGENVEPAGGENDYLDALPASRLRSIDMGVNLGAAPFVMCQAQRHWNDSTSPFLVPQMVGWVLAHDCLPEGVEFWSVLAGEMQMWRDDIRFLPYWKTGLGIQSQTDGIVASTHARPGSVVLWVVNTTRQDHRAVVQIHPEKLGLAAGRRMVVFDAETGDPVPLQNNQVTVDVPARMWRAVRIEQPRLLAPGETFRASFETEIAADESLGNPYPRGTKVLPPTATGKAGKGAPLDQALTFEARQHVITQSGTVAFDLHCGSEGRGTVLDINGVRVMLDHGRFSVVDPRPGPTSLASQLQAMPPLSAAPAWHAIVVSWQAREFRVAVDGTPAAFVQLGSPLPLNTDARGLQIIGDPHLHPSPPGLTFGPIASVVMDNLVMKR